MPTTTAPQPTTTSQGFFDPAQTTLGPEPPGFDILREMLVRQIIDQKQNPYGMSQAGMGNIQGPLFSSGVRNAPGLDYMGMGTSQPPAGGGGGGGQVPPSARMAPIQAQQGGRPATQAIGQRKPPQQGWFWELLRQLQSQTQNRPAPRTVARDGVSYDGPLAGSWGPDNVWHTNPAQAQAYRESMLQREAGSGKDILDMPGWKAVNYASAGHSGPAAMIGPNGQIQYPGGTDQGMIRGSNDKSGAAPPTGLNFNQQSPWWQQQFGGGQPNPPASDIPAPGLSNIPQRPITRSIGQRPTFGTQQPMTFPGPVRPNTQVR